jgi:hypothetical protein
MAKAKKDDAEVYDVPALVITPDKAPVVSGNYEAIEAVLEKWSKKVSSMKLTEDNLDEVSSIKRAAVAVRNQLDAKIDAAKKLLFNDPKKIFEARMKALYALVAGVEGAADKVLDKLEEERVSGVNEVIDHYIGKFQAQYNLDEERLARIERKKAYYNKTAEEKARKDDIEQQFKDLKKDQDAYAADVRLIKAACKDEPRLNVQHWIDQLRYDGAAVVIEAVAAEKERLNGLDAQAGNSRTASSAVEDAEFEVIGEGEAEGGPVKLGVPSRINFNSDFKGRTKSMKIELVYPCDLGDALTELFVELKQYGIKVRPVKARENKKEEVF